MRSEISIESLESRRLFAAAAVLVGNVLTITGSDAKDTVLIKNHVPIAETIDVVLNGVTSHFLRDAVASISISALGGADSIDLRQIGIASRIYGGDGNDTIYGSQVKDRISGGNGNDWINGQAGNDTLYGDAGADRLFGDNGKDALYGGKGIDYIRGGKLVDRIIATIGVDDLKGNKGDIVTNIVQ